LLYARRKGWGLAGVEVDLRYEPGRGGARDRIELRLALGGELTAEQTARLREVARRCPVHRMLAGGVELAED
jgi:putative redox protein